MDTKHDIESRQDIEKLLMQFYEQVKLDPTIGIIFTDIVKMDWDHHIPLITDFWESILLDNPIYKNNAMGVHYKLNEKYPLRKEHFDAWLQLFSTTVDDHFFGPKASLAKTRAKGIADLMLFKMNKTNLI
jgi:hemoglobin